MYGHLHRVKQELARNPRAWLNDEAEHFCPMAEAASNGRVNVFRYFMELARKEGPEFFTDYINSPRQKIQYPALQRAATGQHLEVVELLVSNGADVSFKDPSGWTLLMTACESSDPCIVDCLLGAAGIDVNAVDKYRNCALLLAAIRRDEDAAPIVKSLLWAGADPTFKGMMRKTPLELVHDNDSPDREVVRLLEVRFHLYIKT